MKQNIKTVLISLLSCWAVMLVTGISVRNPLSIILFVLLLFSFKQIQPCIGISFPSAIAAFLLTSSFVLANHKEYTSEFSSSLFKAMAIIIIVLGLFLLFYMMFLWLLSFLQKHIKEVNILSVSSSPSEKRIKDKSEILCSIPFCMLVCFLCQLPFFLYEFPGIMSPDSINQFEQVVGFSPLSNHHPLVHTLLIGLFYRIGLLFTNNQNIALSFYTVSQMIFISFCASCVIRVLRKHGLRKRFCLLVLAFYALIPFNNVYAVTIWKDVPFSGIFMLFTIVLFDLTVSLDDATYSNSFFVKKYIELFILGVSMCLFRSNGWYCFLVLTPFLLWFLRKKFKELLIVCLMVIITAGVVRGPVMDAFGVEEPDFIESCSVPLQQITRVIVDSKPLTDDEQELISNVIDTTYIKQLYAANFADNMKELVRAGNEDYLVNHKAEYLKLWATLGIKYPGTYLQAFVELTKSYWYPDINSDPGDIDGIIANNTGVYSTSIIGGHFIVKAKEILLKLGAFIPGYGLLFSMGMYTFLLIILSCIILSFKRPLGFIKNSSNKSIHQIDDSCNAIGPESKHESQIHGEFFVLLMPCICLLFTLLIASPTAEFRYFYPIVMTMPLLIGATVIFLARLASK